MRAYKILLLMVLINFCVCEKDNFKTVEDVKSVKNESKPIEDAKTIEDVKSVENESKPIENAKTIEDVKSVKNESKPIEDAKTIEDVKSVENESKPIENAKTIEDVKSVKNESKPIEDAKTIEGVKNYEDDSDLVEVENSDEDDSQQVEVVNSDKDNSKPVEDVKNEQFETVELKTKYGVLSGKVERTFLKKQNYFSFKGIPFAEPPVGKLRFKPPVSHQGWNNTLKTYHNKPTCVQFNTRARADEPLGISGSEDCLYISIFTPNLDGTAPVVVFDYNDNFRTGFNGTNTYSPEFFIEETVIVVTISHRLSLFGYLTTMDDVIPPNNGLRDFILGLNWIKENINSFGGDPKRVTLMGNRGGAVLADILLHSEKAKGLFSGVIMQSGTALEATFFGSNLKEKAFQFGKLFNVTTDDSKILLDELQKLDAKALIDRDGEVMDVDEINDLQLNIFPFAPVIENSNDDAVVKCLPENCRLVNEVPIMIGMNSREGLDLATHYLFDPRLVKQHDGDFFFLFPVRSTYAFVRKSSTYDEVIKEISSFYYKEGYFYYGNILEHSVYMGDLLQNYALNLAARTLASKSYSSVYYYMFDFRGSLNENINYLTKYARFGLEPWGATILDELCYLHICSRIKDKYEDLQKLLSEQKETRVLKKMVRLWTNFAKTGDPTPDEDDDILKDFKWEPVDKGAIKIDYLHISKNLQMKVNPLGKREHFWNDFLNRYYHMISEDGDVKSTETGEELQAQWHDEL